jgi:plastocyanin
MRTFRHRIAGIALVATIASGYAGSAVAQAQTQDSAQAIRDVAVRDDFFNPARIQIRRGDSIRWTNRGEDQHTTTSDMGFWNRLLNPGDTFTLRFPRTGTFPYHCNFHSDMRGAVRVVP